MPHLLSLISKHLFECGEQVLRVANQVLAQESNILWQFEAVGGRAAGIRVFGQNQNGDVWPSGCKRVGEMNAGWPGTKVHVKQHHVGVKLID